MDAYLSYRRYFIRFYHSLILCCTFCHSSPIVRYMYFFGLFGQGCPSKRCQGRHSQKDELMASAVTSRSIHPSMLILCTYVTCVCACGWEGVVTTTKGGTHTFGVCQCPLGGVSCLWMYSVSSPTKVLYDTLFAVSALKTTVSSSIPVGRSS